MTNLHLREIDLSNINIIVAYWSHAVRIDAVDMNLVTCQIPVHVVVEITYNIHILLPATGGVCFTSVKSAFLGGENAIDDRILKIVLRQYPCRFKDACRTCRIVVSTRCITIPCEGIVVTTTNDVCVRIKSTTLNSNHILAVSFSKP